MKETRAQRRERERREDKLAAQIANASALESKERSKDVLALVGFACTLASWGWSAVPNASPIFGSILLFIAAIAIAFAVRRRWSLGKLAFTCVACLAIVGFVAFDWHVVIKPQRGKPFKELLAHGYHLTSECGQLPAKQQMPSWMRDEAKGWQAQVEQLVLEKLQTKDIQRWRDAIIYGRVTDENTVAYQCMWLANKVGALETIVSTEYDPDLKHQDYNGPTYWFEPVNGKVDISDAFKGGRQQANVAIEDFSEDDKQPKK